MMMSVFAFIVQFVGPNHLLCPFLVVQCVSRLRKRQKNCDSGEVAGPRARIGNITCTRGRRSAPSALSSLFTKRHSQLRKKSPARLLAPKRRGRGGGEILSWGIYRINTLYQSSWVCKRQSIDKQDRAVHGNQTSKIDELSRRFKHDKKWK